MLFSYLGPLLPMSLLTKQKKPITKDRPNASKRYCKESTGFEPARRDEPGRRISSPLHYHSANSPYRLFSSFFRKSQEKICNPSEKMVADSLLLKNKNVCSI